MIHWETSSAKLSFTMVRTAASSPSVTAVTVRPRRAGRPDALKVAYSANAAWCASCVVVVVADVCDSSWLLMTIGRIPGAELARWKPAVSILPVRPPARLPPREPCTDTTHELLAGPRLGRVPVAAGVALWGRNPGWVSGAFTAAVGGVRGARTCCHDSGDGWAKHSREVELPTAWSPMPSVRGPSSGRMATWIRSPVGSLVILNDCDACGLLCREPDVGRDSRRCVDMCG